MNAKLALITFLDSGPVDPGYGQPGFGGGPRPDQGLPGGGAHPWLPGHVGGGPRPDQGLPGSGGHPEQGLPGSGGRPTQPIYLPVLPTDPEKPPTAEQPDLPTVGDYFELKYLARFGWVLVPIGDEDAEPKDESSPVQSKKR